MMPLAPCTPPALLTCRVLDSFAAIDQATWNERAGGVPFREWDWCESWWRHYATRHDRLLLLATYDVDDRLVGLAPWYVARSPLAGRVIRFLGSGDVCSDFLSLVCRPNDSAAVAAAVGRWLTHEGRSRWDLLDLDGVDEGDAPIEALVEHLGDAGHTTAWHTTMNTWRIALPVHWDAYVQRLSKSRREKTRQLVRRAFDAGFAVPRLLQEPAEFDHHWQTFERLYQLRRAELGQRDGFSDPRFAPFHRDVARRLFERGQLRLHITELRGEPIAAEYGIAGSGTVYMYQSGMDPRQADERPGWLNTIGTLRLAIEQGYTAYDFLRGDEPYKRSWGAVPRPIWRVRVVGQGCSARCRDAIWQMGTRTKQWLRTQREHWLAPRGGARQVPGDESNS